jgi:hypothetical protein
MFVGEKRSRVRVMWRMVLGWSRQLGESVGDSGDQFASPGGERESRPVERCHS